MTDRWAAGDIIASSRAATPDARAISPEIAPCISRFRFHYYLVVTKRYSNTALTDLVQYQMKAKNSGKASTVQLPEKKFACASAEASTTIMPSEHLLVLQRGFCTMYAIIFAFAFVSTLTTGLTHLPDSSCCMPLLLFTG